MDYSQQAQKLVGQMTTEEKCGQMRYNSPAIPRLGIPEYNWWNECLHGVGRSGTATVFPQAIAMAASFNTGLMKDVATAISDEARAKYNEYKKFGSTLIYQGLTYWSPNINIFRDPRWGRGHETYGEDPLLTGRMGCAFIEGLQGDDPVHRKLDATIKHYAVHSGPEKGRHSFDSIATQQELQQTYMWAFLYCIQHADPSAVMGAYNRINGEAACASPTYLKEMLYKTFGFDGYVVSDCGAIEDINEHHKLTKDTTESVALAVNNGCTLNCGKAYEWLVDAVQKGLVSEETLDESVQRLMKARLRLGMLETTVYDVIPYDIIDCARHRALNIKMAQESIVLLKNKGILPLKPRQDIAVIGPNADDKSVLMANYSGTASSYTTILRGIQGKSEGKVVYARGCHLYDDGYYPWQEQPLREALIAAQKSDVVVLCMGLTPGMEGEEGDAYNGINSGDKFDIELPSSQLTLLQEVAKLCKPIVFVNVSGSCVALPEADALCDAVLQVFYPGAQGGHAVAEILFGAANPSGALPVTLYKSTKDLPDFCEYSMKNRTYQYFEGDALYPFGHGLSYTQFKLDVQELTTESGLRATLTNSGNSAGSCVVLVFAKDVSNSELKGRLAGFAKWELHPGQSKQVEIALTKEVLELFPNPKDIQLFCAHTGNPPQF